MLHRCARLGGILLVAGAVAGPVWAAPNAQDFDQRLSALERAVGSAGAGQSQAQLVIQLQQMQAEIRQLRGMVEESANQVEQLQKRQREFYLDLDSRLSALESSGGTPREAAQSAAGGAAEHSPPAAPAELPSAAEPAAPPVEGAGPVERPVAPVVTASPPPPAAEPVPPVATVPPSVSPAPDVSGGEQAAYRAASELLRMGRYEDAIAGFRGQLKAYPGGALADNAQYWIGEAYYVTRQFDRALAEFQRVPSEYPQSPKAADALLKIGYIQYERREFSAARQTLTNLKATWPNSPAARLADNRLARMKEEGV
jgi:tol-pal system protein YbgF